MQTPGREDNACYPGRPGTQPVAWGFPYSAANIETACTEFGYWRFLPASNGLRDSEPTCQRLAADAGERRALMEPDSETISLQIPMPAGL